MDDLNLDFQLINEDDNTYTIYHKGRIYRMSLDEYESEFIGKLPEEWTSTNDRIIMLNSYESGTGYKCTKEREYYDFKSQSYSKKLYNFDYVSQDDFKPIYEIMMAICEDYHIRWLQEKTEEIKSFVKKSQGFYKINLDSKRKAMLKASDWTVLPDVPFTEEKKNQWKLYRQTLRDMGNDINWITNKMTLVQFPMDPDQYSMYDPEETVEYLSIPEHFNNPALLYLKLKLLKIIQRISNVDELISRGKVEPFLAGASPGASNSDQLTEIFEKIQNSQHISEQETQVAKLAYDEMFTYVNSRLQQIDSNWNWELNIIDGTEYD